MIKGKTKQKIYFTICDILSIINKIIPKNKNKILFFSSNDISDNSKALLDYMVSNNYTDNYTIVCSSKNSANLCYESSNMKFISPSKGIFHILTSKYIFFHGEIIAISPSASQVSINLWHGSPLKKFNKLATKLSDYRYDFFTYLLAASDFFKPIMKDCFDCNIDKVKVLGHARNDLLFEESNILDSLSINKSNFNKIFLWMPTFRISKDNYIVDIDSELKSQTGLPIYSTEKDLYELNSYLQNRNSLILIKLHPAQNLDFIKMDDYANINFLTNDYIESKGYHLYNLVAQCDSLITDYSSIYFDYLLLDRPIGFTIDDIESYIRNRGFVVDNPLDLMPGAKINTPHEFFDFLDTVIDEKDSYSNERSKICDLSNKYKSNNNRELILKFTGIKKETHI